MTNQPLDEEAIFLAALEKQSQEERSAFVEKACADRPDLLERVRELLNSHDESMGPLDSPIASVNATIDQPITEKPGAQIGPYKLLQQLGEGGMGVVYMAEQKEPVKRRVALKIIKPGMDTRQVIARFEAERQALAMMDHPNIAKVLDAGATESGRPYFVMELVNGVSITQYCDEQHLTPKERLELFVSICQAVQHAHQKGIIHRDLKPSNILVAEYDHKAVPKIIDFGVAKATSQTLTEKTMFTQLGQIVGTLEYMSPEQAKRNQPDVDTRSDIYSLGVVLYELLTGETPFDRARLRSAALDEMLRIIREEEPSKPSTKVSSSQSLPSIAANRRIEPAKLGSMIRGELDWIVLKAMEKDRGRRYETASKFAEDVQHYLNDVAVVACPPSRAYKFRKFARRNKVALATITVVGASLIVGLLGTAWQAHRATEAERQAWQEAGRAKKAEELAEQRLATVSEQKERIAEEKTRTEEQTDIAKAVNAFLTEDLLGMTDAAYQVENKVTPDPNIRLRVLLDRASNEIEQRFTNQPKVKAAIHHTIGSAYRSIGVLLKAEEHLERAKELRLNELGAYHPDTLSSTHGLAICYVYQDRFSDAEKLFQSSLESQRRILGGEHANTLKTMGGLAAVYWHLGRINDAEQLYAKILEVRRRTLGNEHADTLDGMDNLAVVYSDQGKYADAITLGRESLEEKKRTLGSEHPSTLVTMSNLASYLERAGNLDDAKELYLETLDVQRRVLGNEHLATIYTMSGLANTYRAQERYPDAQKLYQKAYEIRQRDLGAEHSDTLSSLTSLAEVYDKQLRYSDAETLLARALESLRRILGDRHAQTLYTMNILAGNYFHQGRYGEAEELYRTTIELSKETVGEEHPSTLAYVGNLAAVYIKLGRYADAETRYKAILEAQRQILGDDHPSTLSTADHLATVLAKRELYDEAEALRRQTLGLRQRMLGNEHPDTLYSKINLAADYSMQRRYQEAETILREAFETQRKEFGDEHPLTVECKQYLAIAHCHIGRHTDAEKLFREVLEIRRRKLGDEHPSTLQSLNNLAGFYANRQRDPEAELLYSQLLEIQRRVLGPKHRDTLWSMEHLARVISRQGRDEEAEKLNREILKLTKKSASDVQNNKRSNLKPP